MRIAPDKIVDVGKDPAIAAKIRVQGIAPASIGLQDFNAYMQNDMARLAPLLATIAPAKQ